LPFIYIYGFENEVFSKINTKEVLMIDTNTLQLKGHVTIADSDTGEILLDRGNAIHYENLSQSIVQSLIDGPLDNQSSAGFIYSMNFGNGGTTVNSSGIITYNPPNTTGSTAQLYNQTYTKVINDSFAADLDTVNNNLQYSHITGKTYTDLICTCKLDYTEPSDQLSFDNSNDIDTEYAFDELGLFNYSGMLLTHVCFSPIIKSLNRSFTITYTVRISTLSTLTV
jgi:hypothetical protein